MKRQRLSLGPGMGAAPVALHLFGEIFCSCILQSYRTFATEALFRITVRFLQRKLFYIITDFATEITLHKHTFFFVDFVLRKS